MILIIDFGSQFNQLIARRVRECKVYSTILRYDTPAAEIAERERQEIEANRQIADHLRVSPTTIDRQLDRLGRHFECNGYRLLNAVYRFAGAFRCWHHPLVRESKLEG